eukprot:scaffold589_cov343-Prasinococcus_capsulatus_cf.AAC.3
MLHTSKPAAGACQEGCCNAPVARLRRLLDPYHIRRDVPQRLPLSRQDARTEGACSPLTATSSLERVGATLARCDERRRCALACGVGEGVEIGRW